MKKILLILAIILSAINFLWSQNYYHVYDITTFESYHTYYICSDYDGAALHAENGCSYYSWAHNGQSYTNNPLIITHSNQGEWSYNGCNGFHIDFFNIYFSSGTPPTEPWAQNTMFKCPGTLRLYAQTNPQPDYTYLWSTGATTPYIDIDSLRTYGVTVTDACGNSISDEITINGEYPEHEPYLPETTYLCIGGTVTLDAGSGFSSYTWSNGSHNQTITVNQPIEYWVQTVNEYGCEGFASTQVQYMVPQSIDESIPLITIDTINMSNQIMVSWSTTNPYIDEVAIYREGLTNQWQQVGTTNYQTGYFIDDVDGSERSYRYKLSAIDICGGQSELGRSYQSVNAAYLGPGAQYWWIQWTPYKVSDINAADHYELFSVDNLQDFNISPVDAQISYDNALGFYYVNLPHGIQDSVFFVKAYIKNQYGGGTVMSNFVQNYELLGIEENNQTSFSIYPNPNNGTFTVQGTGNLTIVNLLGQIVAKSHTENKSHTFSLAPGIYFIRSDEGIVQKLIIQ